MERRHIVAGTIAGAAATLAAPAVAQTMPKVRWRCASSFPRPVMEACYRAAFELYAETVAANANFRKVWEHMRAFRDLQLQWFRVAENTYDSFVYAMQASEARR